LAISLPQIRSTDLADWFARTPSRMAGSHWPKRCVFVGSHWFPEIVVSWTPYNRRHPVNEGFTKDDSDIDAARVRCLKIFVGFFFFFQVVKCFTFSLRGCRYDGVDFTSTASAKPIGNVDAAAQISRDRFLCEAGFHRAVSCRHWLVVGQAKSKRYRSLKKTPIF